MTMHPPSALNFILPTQAVNILTWSRAIRCRHRCKNGIKCSAILHILVVITNDNRHSTIMRDTRTNVIHHGQDDTETKSRNPDESAKTEGEMAMEAYMQTHIRKYMFVYMYTYIYIYIYPLSKAFQAWQK